METTLGTLGSLVFGGIVGSFLNVVIYRLPRGLSISYPRWSFCPHCEKRIAPQTNIPILGWLFLGGRCRKCRAPISMMYPAVEVATALVFVMIWDAFFVARVAGNGALAHGWPNWLGHLVLFAALLASAGMDFESYTIHVQVLLFATAAGVLSHGAVGLWDSPGLSSAPLIPPALCAAALTAGAAWLVSETLRRLRGKSPAFDASPSASDPDPGAGDGVQSEGGSTTWRFQPVPIIALSAILAGLTIWQVRWPDSGLVSAMPPWGQRAFVGCFTLLLILILSSLEHREADRQIVEDLEREKPQARSMIRREFASLGPAVASGVIVLILLRWSGHISTGWPDVLRIAGDSAWVGHVAGGVHALSAAVLGAALGWGVRILGTAAFGKEAFGSGDIYILAAIGSTLGLWATMIVFLLASLLALVGVLATSFKKVSRAIPFGPWLALGAFVGMWVQGPLVRFFSPIGWLIWALISGQPLATMGV